jgi:hypothetical protein
MRVNTMMRTRMPALTIIALPAAGAAIHQICFLPLNADAKNFYLSGGPPEGRAPSTHCHSKQALDA